MTPPSTRVVNNKKKAYELKLNKYISYFINENKSLSDSLILGWVKI